MVVADNISAKLEQLNGLLAVSTDVESLIQTELLGAMVSPEMMMGLIRVKSEGSVEDKAKVDAMLREFEMHQQRQLQLFGELQQRFTDMASDESGSQKRMSEAFQLMEQSFDMAIEEATATNTLYREATVNQERLMKLHQELRDFVDNS